MCFVLSSFANHPLDVTKFGWSCKRLERAGQVGRGGELNKVEVSSVPLARWPLTGIAGGTIGNWRIRGVGLGCCWSHCDLLLGTGRFFVRSEKTGSSFPLFFSAAKFRYLPTYLPPCYGISLTLNLWRRTLRSSPLRNPFRKVESLGSVRFARVPGCGTALVSPEN